MVVWADPAKKDLKYIYSYIAKDSIFYARKVLDDIIERAEVVGTMQQMGRIVPEINRREIREVFVYSYRIIYEIEDDTSVTILAIIHGKKNFDSFG